MANNKKENEEKSKKTTSTKKTTVNKSTTKKTTTTKSGTKKTASTKKATTKNSPKKVVNQKENNEPKKEEKKHIIEVTEVLEEPKKVPKEEELSKTIVIQDILNIEKGKSVNSRLVIYLIAFAVAILVGGFCYIYDFSKQKKDPEPTYNLDEYFDEFGNIKNASQENKNNEKDVSSSNYENIKEISIEEYQMRLEHKEKMLILVASHTCGICASYEPVLSEVLKEANLNAYKIDIANFTKKEEVELFKSLFNITGTPVTFVIENGAIKTSQSGGKSKDITAEFIRNNY